MFGELSVCLGGVHTLGRTGVFAGTACIWGLCALGDWHVLGALCVRRSECVGDMGIWNYVILGGSVCVLGCMFWGLL